MKRFRIVQWMLMTSFVAALLMVAGSTTIAHALTDEQLLQMTFVDEEVYIVRLENGDILHGPIVEFSEDETGAFIRVASVIGRAKIYAKEIHSIASTADDYRHRHRGYLLPTAQPIGNDAFIALVEGVLPYVGIGIGEWLSVTAGRTLIPGVAWSDQASLINAKFTLHSAPNGLVEGGEQVYAVGVNGGWINDVNFLGHVYGVATFTGKRTQATLMMFAKVAGKDVYTVKAGNFFGPAAFPLANGTFGVGIGLDTRFPEMRDLHFVGELWNADLTKPANTALYLGLRLTNRAVASDFGFTVVPGPFIIPTIAFAWTPLE